MRRLITHLSVIAFVVTLLAFGLIRSPRTLGQNKAESGSSLNDDQIGKIIQAFTSKEARFRKALNNYSFKRDALVQSLGMGGQVTGEYHRVSFFTFDDQGARDRKSVV